MKVRFSARYFVLMALVLLLVFAIFSVVKVIANDYTKRSMHHSGEFKNEFAAMKKM